MSDVTDCVRQDLIEEVNKDGRTWKELVAAHGRCWTEEEMRREFAVVGFMAPYFVNVRRRSDNRHGTLQFRHNPRIYYSWLSSP
jgi:hypothetical protein